MKSFTRLLPVLLLAACCTGCVLTPRSHVQREYYDLQSPVAGKINALLMVSAVSNDSPAQSRMLFRFAGNRMVHDNNNCWVQMPERMLQRYLEQAFALPDNTRLSKTASLRCTITAFEFDMIKSEAVLAMKYEMRYDLRHEAGTLLIKEKIKSNAPTELADAMSRAAGKAAEQIGRAAGKIRSGN